MSQATWQAVLAVLESDLVTIEGPPILQALATIKANPTPVQELGAWVALQGSFVSSLPQLESTLITQVATALQTKLTAAFAKVQAAHPA